jgi:hypothetical protein
MRVTFLRGDFLPADVAHGISAIADEFVAAGRFDEAEKAFRASSFDGCGGGGFDGRAK